MAEETTTETAPTKRRPARAEAKCSKEGCKRPYRAKGYCVTHYKQWRRGAMEGHTARYKTCTKEGCRKPRAAGSLCAEHAKGGEG
jgi:hypothetical protein